MTRCFERKVKYVGLFGIVLALLLSLVRPGTILVYAEEASSPNYRIDQFQIGTGADFNLSSDNYKGQATTGSTAVGTQTSSNYRDEAGFLVMSKEYLELSVGEATIDLGQASENATVYGSASFTVRSYLASSYTVVTVSDPPKNEYGNTINALKYLTSPTPGTEQFGINLVANTVPGTFGANLVNEPSSDYASGNVNYGYASPNLYKYVKGDAIASSPSANGTLSYGQTTYTISYIMNISSITRAGKYTMGHSLMAVATY